MSVFKKTFSFEERTGQALETFIKAKQELENINEEACDEIKRIEDEIYVLSEKVGELATLVEQNGNKIEKLSAIVGDKDD